MFVAFAKVAIAVAALSLLGWPPAVAAGVDQGEIGGSTAQAEEVRESRPSVALPMAMSLVLPGLGEVVTGHRRGYILMAVDIASWIGVKHYHDLGNEKRDEYYDFADLYWSEDRLRIAYDSVTNPDAPGSFYFDVDNYLELPLWVSIEEDRREYYENLGKWDQFVFGWEDFSDPRNYVDLGPDYTSQDLQDPRTSALREAYRRMREDSNDQFTNRDRLLYLNMVTRVFSAFQVAYLQGALGGGPRSEMRVAGHPVMLIADPCGWRGGRLGVAVSW